MGASRRPGETVNNEGENVLYPEANVDEHGLDAALRPTRFDDFVGQDALKRNLMIYIKAAKMRGEPLDHLLLSGLPGLGKTTLAEIVAREMGTELHTTSGPVIEKPGDLTNMLTAAGPGDLLFIDEIHRLSPAVEEYLYSAMEDFLVDIVLEQGPGGRSVRLPLKRFTLVGATTREGLLTPPFRARFGVLERLEPYPTADLETIVKRSAGLLGMSITDEGAQLLASHARGTPRVVNRFVRRMRDVAQVEGQSMIDGDIARRGLSMLGVDRDGLLRVDRQILEVISLAGGEPVGLRTIAVSIGEDERTIEDVYEPHLIRSGFILKGPRGRRLTARGLAIVGDPSSRSAESQGHLFDEPSES